MSGAAELMSGTHEEYYPNAIYEESFFSANPDDPAPAEIAGAPARECSVRGCANPVDLLAPDPITNRSLKMCAPCREKHRSYASTKRARRKAEKILVSRLSAGEVPQIQATQWANEVLTGNATVTAQYSSPIVATAPQSTSQPQPTVLVDDPPSEPVQWVIDPALYSQPSGPSSSSTLAGALTLPPSTDPPSNNPLAALPAGPAFHSSSIAVPRDLNTGNFQDGQVSVATASAPSLPNASPSHSGVPLFNANGTAGVASQALANEKPRYCSVKGCKAIILETIEEYAFKMCRNCRDKYRNYGITKRAKWKAERETYDKELEGLRVKEDMRRAAEGLPLLVDSEEELRAWELSLIEEHVPNHQYTPRGGVAMPMGPLDTRYSHQVPSAVPLPARMCTVSHCHKILPGFYRYKRCETHRVQNRWHSKLKRGREKIDKGFMLPDGTPLVAPGPIRLKKVAETKDPKEPKEKKSRKKRGGKGKEVEGGEGVPAEENVDGAPDETNSSKPVAKRSKDATSCRGGECLNLIMPGTRWRTCDICRAQKRDSRREQRMANKLQATGSFTNITPDAVETVSDFCMTPATALGSGISIPIVTADPSATPGDSVSNPPEHTSTSTLLTVNEPLPDKSERPESVRTVRKYRKWPRYHKDASAESGSNAVASSSATPSFAAASAQPPSHPSPYPYPGPGAFPCYMPSQGYYDMPPPPVTTAPGQPRLVFIPSPYPYAMRPPPSTTGIITPSLNTPAPFPYYYPYAAQPPGYGMPQHYPRAHYAYPPPTQITTGGQPTPYAMYKSYSTPQSQPQPQPPLAASPTQGYTFYRFKNDVQNPPELPNKRRRLSDEADGLAQDERQQRTTTSAPPSAGSNEPPDEPSSAATAVSAATIVSTADVPMPPPEELPLPLGTGMNALNENEQVSVPETAPQRMCASKTCSRALVSGAPGPLCDRCRAKMKKRQAMTKQRFRLEPKKITGGKGGVSFALRDLEKESSLV
ncbi:hypothetical protein B0H15DRAFT_1016974 [Mycena belliarum]|uniref:Uncharacterized protein n=1 Tax=Mycena belliarum TaxID=1033014 RepID=A0AAD6XXH5_9AGAR|nr:hypothetical protein B0H15DRAFT_1016974 [Mycena belliae]